MRSVHRDEFKRVTVLTLCILKSINVNLKQQMYIEFTLSEVTCFSPSLWHSWASLGRGREGAGRASLGALEVSRTAWLKKGRLRALFSAPRESLTIPNSGLPSHLFPVANGREAGRWGGGGSWAWRGYKRQRAAGRLPRHPAAGALLGTSEGRTDAAQHRDHSARGPGGSSAMLRVRCLRGGSRGAEAVHYIGSRVRAPCASLCSS